MHILILFSPVIAEEYGVIACVSIIFIIFTIFLEAYIGQAN